MVCAPLSYRVNIGRNVSITRICNEYNARLQKLETSTFTETPFHIGRRVWGIQLDPIINVSACKNVSDNYLYIYFKINNILIGLRSFISLQFISTPKKQ